MGGSGRSFPPAGGGGGDARAVLYRHFCGGFFYGMAVLTGFLGYGFVWGSSGTSL